MNEPEHNDGVVSYQSLPWRGVTEATMRKYKVLTKVVGEEPISLGFQYPTFAKVRQIKPDAKGKKVFYIKGDRVEGLYGKDVFPKDTFRTIIVVEGELDALSAYQMTNHPAVSLQSASQTNLTKEDHEYLNSADRIILALDNDEPGQRATKLLAQMFSFDKVFKANLEEFKDANDYLTNGKSREFGLLIQNAKKFVPDGIISSYGEVGDLFRHTRRKGVVEFPFAEGETKLEGLRLGTSILLSGAEGIGKTEVARAIEYKTLKDTDYNIGIIHLEEAKEDTLNYLLPYETGIPIRRASVEISPEEKLRHYKSMTKRDNRVFIYSHFGSSDPNDFLGIVRYLVATCGCKFIFFDHINVLVSGLNIEGDERRMLDYLCTKLEMMVEELDFCLVMICHENDDGKPRGSRNMSQTAHVHIRLSRDKENPNDYERNKLHMSVSKNRPVGPTGPIGYAYFDENRGCLVEPQKHPYNLPNLGE